MFYQRRKNPPNESVEGGTAQRVQPQRVQTYRVKGKGFIEGHTWPSSLANPIWKILTLISNFPKVFIS